MRNLIRSTFAIFAFISLPVQASTPLDEWVMKKQEELFHACDSTTHKPWFTRYQEIQVEWFENLATLGEVTAESRMKNSSFFQFAKIVFPQALPEEVPLKGAYLHCFDQFMAMRDAKSNPQFKDAVNAFVVCSENGYGSERPELLDRYTGCLKQLIMRL